MSHSYVIRGLLLLGLVMVGCQGSDFHSAAAGPSAAPGAFDSGIVGFVARVNPVFIVDSMVNAPERARPQANAMVTALDPEGRVVGMSLTGPDGRFRLDSIPPGKVTLEARVEPSSGAANVTLEMTSSGKGLLHPNAKYPVSREAAAQIALEGKSYPLVTGTLNPLPEGTVVDAFEGAASGGRVLPADEWLFMINEGPLLGYAHPVEFVFVDARTGARAQFSAQFYPTINGVSMWGSTDYLFQYAAGSAPLAGPEVVQVSPELLSLLANTRQIEDILARNNTTADSIFAVLLGLDTGFENGVPLFQKFLVDRGVPMANIRTVMYDDTERNALTRPKVVNDKNIPKYSSILVPRIRAAFDQINALINDRFRRGQHSSEIVLITSHGSAAIPGGIVIGGDSVGGFGNFIDLGMVRNLSCRIDFLVDCCYSGRFITELHKFLKDNEFPHQCFFYSSSGLKEFTQSGGLLPQTGKWLVFVTQAAQVTQGGLEGLKGTKPMEQVPKLQEITHTLPKGNAQEAPSNPIYLDFTPAKDPCPTTSPTPPGNPPPKVPTSNDQTSRLEFENRSQDRETLRLAIDGAAQDLILEPAGRPGSNFFQEFSVPISTLRVEEFQESNARIPVMNTAFIIPPGASRILFWEESGGTRTLSSEVSFPSAPDIGVACSRVIYRNRSSRTVTVSFVAANQTINGGQPISLAPGQEFSQSFEGPIEDLDLIEFSGGTPLANGFQFDVACGFQQMFQQDFVLIFNREPLPTAP